MRSARTAAALPGVAALAAGLLLIPFEGGFRETAWYPAALFLAAFAALAAFAVPGVVAGIPRLLRIALGLYAAFTAWTFLSIAWADVPGDAWEGANRTLLYGVVLLLAAMVPWNRASARVALVLAAGGITVAAVIVLLSVSSGEPGHGFLEGRLADPTRYANATAALWMIGFWPAVHMATERRLHFVLRGFGLGAAVLLVETAVLSQSRGAFFGFAATALVYVLLHPRRWKAVGALAVVVGLTALGWSDLTAVRDATSVTQLSDLLDTALRTILLSAAAGLVIGLAAALAGPALIRGPLGGTAGGRFGDWALLAIAVAAFIAGLAVIGNPGTWVGDRWKDFKNTGYTQVEAGRTRFTGGLGSNRYDFWRVAWNEFAAHPVQGIGSDNFAVPYLRHRRVPEAPRYPHSLAFRLLSQLGLVGTGLFVAFLGLMSVAVLRARRFIVMGDGAALGIGAFAGFAYWILHGLGDWLWEFPALGVISFALLGVAARTGLPPDPPRRPREAADMVVAEPEPTAPAGIRVLRRAGVAAIGLAVALSLALPGIAARFVRAAYRDYRADPDLALRRLDRAANLDFLSADPLVARGLIARRLGRTRVAEAALEEAVERSPKSWFAQFELGLTQSGLGERTKALDSVQKSESLNPRQPLIRQVRAKLTRAQKVDADAVEQALYGQFESKLRPTGSE